MSALGSRLMRKNCRRRLLSRTALGFGRIRKFSRSREFSLTIANFYDMSGRRRRCGLIEFNLDTLRLLAIETAHYDKLCSYIHMRRGHDVDYTSRTSPSFAMSSGLRRSTVNFSANKTRPNTRRAGFHVLYDS